MGRVLLSLGRERGSGRFGPGRAFVGFLRGGGTRGGEGRVDGVVSCARIGAELAVRAALLMSSILLLQIDVGRSVRNRLPRRRAIETLLLVALAGRLLQALFENLVAEDGLEEGVHHLGDEPDFRDFLEGIHAGVHALLRCVNDRLDVGAHLVDVHDQGGEEGVDAGRREVSSSLRRMA